MESSIYSGEKEEYEEEELNPLDPFSVLPVEKIEEICHNLDKRSLGKFATTSKRNKAICKRELDLRKILSELIGDWKRCISKSYGKSWEELNISDKGDMIEVKTKTYVGAKNIPSRMVERNLESLQSLRDELLDGRFIRIDLEKDFWGDEYQIHYPGEWAGYYYNKFSAEKLGLKIIEGESIFKLQQRMKRELIRRNKFLHCVKVPD